MRYESLGNLVSITSGGTPSKNCPDYWCGNTPWISAKEMTSDIVFESTLHISSEAVKFSNIAPANSILLLTRGSGLFNEISLNWVTSEVAFNQDIKCLNCEDKLLLKYLYYYLKSTKDLQSILDVTGIGAGKFDTQRIKDIQIPIYDKSTLMKIISVCDSIYNKIYLNSKINANLLELLKIQFTRVLKLSNDSIRLGHIADIQTGPFGSQLHQEDYVKDGTPLVSVENLGEFHLNRKHLPGITPEDCIRLSRYLMKEGDIIFSRVGYVDRSSYVSKMEDGWMFSGSCLRIRNNNPDYSLYTYLFLNTNLSKETFKSIAVGATRPSINSSILSEFEIIVPPKSDVKQFNDYALKLESMMTINMIEIEKLTILRDYLLPKLMSGEINVSTLEIHN